MERSNSRGVAVLLVGSGLGVTVAVLTQDPVAAITAGVSAVGSAAAVAGLLRSGSDR